MIWKEVTFYDAMDHRTVPGVHHCRPHLHSDIDIPDAEGVTRNVDRVWIPCTT